MLSQSIRVASDGDWCHGWVVDDQETQHIFKRHEGIENCRIDFSSFPSLTYFQFSPRGRSDETKCNHLHFLIKIKKLCVLLLIKQEEFAGNRLAFVKQCLKMKRVVILEIKDNIRYTCTI
ncbi:MAG: hypothetical protein LRY43_04780 [Gammaproteobacteria bacterium]|nr:hypothetical protein [Gammaproteobacteria bacterium]